LSGWTIIRWISERFHGVGWTFQHSETSNNSYVYHPLTLAYDELIYEFSFSYWSRLMVQSYGLTLCGLVGENNFRFIHFELKDRTSRFFRNTCTKPPHFNNNNIFVALARERTIPTKRPPLVGEVSANFSG
jgi:hypothetical protein